ncbi:hypothetical protein DEO72_LG11g1073 [Vigna unguiculata]|uniref:Uncharacterized protein n=1 Tax=Vigna unguiculata TaxID=3917 RepID=A0A4D6NPB9_VIGUN|nr:hypothetical protein DEO72_LG11g1073 [Vigna unguiculata]
MPRFSAYPRHDIFSDFSASFTISGQPSPSSPLLPTPTVTPVRSVPAAPFPISSTATTYENPVRANTPPMATDMTTRLALQRARARASVDTTLTLSEVMNSAKLGCGCWLSSELELK